MSNLDPQHLSFSQAQGYEDLPQLLKLEELSDNARTAIWNVLFTYVDGSLKYDGVEPWNSILLEVYSDFFHGPLDKWLGALSFFRGAVRDVMVFFPFSEVFDCLTMIMRHQLCPPGFAEEVGATFRKQRLAYHVDLINIPTIYPMSTLEEGNALVESLKQLDNSGHVGARQHLQNAATNINQQDWAGSIRESIHAVESVACQIAPGTKTLSVALRVLRQRGLLAHPALEQGVDKIYGYTNDERGIRHALLDQSSADVGQDEAIFMFGACASFASYLSRKALAIQG